MFKIPLFLEKDIVIVPGMGGVIPVTQILKVFQLLAPADATLCHPSDHLPPGHLAQRALFHHPAVLTQLAEGAGEHLHRGGRWGSTARLYSWEARSTTKPASPASARASLSPREGVQTGRPFTDETGLHLQAVGAVTPSKGRSMP